jgi:formylglycine-generating enzyme required for sulfatase activity
MSAELRSKEPLRHLLWPKLECEMVFRLIPKDMFRMGSRGYYPSEEPVHQVRIQEDFWMAETPVTQAQFALWTQAEEIKHENDFQNRPDRRTANHPAENMDWRQAVAYCDWITRTMKVEFPPGFHLACLPTEAEWEYACRAGTETEYYTGDGEAALAEAGWFDENLETGSTHPVRQKAPNRFQLFDLHGNVWEYCHDFWDDQAHRSHADGDPDPGAEVRYDEWGLGLESMLKSDQTRVLRGGSWHYPAWHCRSAYRFWLSPDVRDGDFGFRVCLVRGPAGQTDSMVEPAPGDVGRGTRQESDGSGGAGEAAPDLAQASFPREAGRKKS